MKPVLMRVVSFGRCAFGIYDTRTLRENQFGTTVLVTGYPGAGASWSRPEYGHLFPVSHASTAWLVPSPDGSRFGKNAASKPTAGRNEQTVYTKLMLVMSANSPRMAAPSPAIPKANPKQRPEIIPTLPGTNS